MSVREFLDAAYVLLVERFRSLGPSVSLDQALEMAAEFKAGLPDETPTAGGSSEQTSFSETARLAQEERDLAELDAMMAGAISRNV